VADLARWAKVVVVDGVMALIYHNYDSEDGCYAIHCVIQASVGEVDTKIRRRKAWTQKEFDRIDSDVLVRSAIGGIRNMGFEPVGGA